MSAASTRALEQLRAQEAVLHAQQAEAAAEVARLQAMVDNAKADLQETELASVSAKKAVTSACRSFEDCSPETDPLLSHAAASHVDPVGSRLDAAAAAAADAGCADSCDGSSDGEDEVPVDAAVRPVHIARPGGSGEKLGLFFSNRTTEITRVHPGFAAARAGLTPGWFVRRVCRAETRTLAELDAALQAAAADFTVDVSRAPPEEGEEEEEEDAGGAAGGRSGAKEEDGVGTGGVNREGAGAVGQAGGGGGGGGGGGSDASEDEFVLVGDAETLETPPAVLLETPGSPVERMCVCVSAWSYITIFFLTFPTRRRRVRRLLRSAGQGAAGDRGSCGRGAVDGAGSCCRGEDTTPAAAADSAALGGGGVEQHVARVGHRIVPAVLRQVRARAPGDAGGGGGARAEGGQG